MRLADMRMRVVVVDDDRDYLEALKEQLEDRGVAVSAFSSGATLLRSLQVAANADILVLDWKMPHMAGIELLVRLREAGIKVPIVFLTGPSLVEHERAALQAGALDFIDKARGSDILVRRLIVIVRRSRDALAGQAVVPALRLGALVLHAGTSRAEWRGLDVGLTTTEYKIVALLAASPGKFATSREIYDTMHYVGFLAGQGTHGVMTNVRSSIKRIRQKFLRVDPAFGEIINQSGRGYGWRRPAPTLSPSSADPPPHSDVRDPP